MGLKINVGNAVASNAVSVNPYALMLEPGHDGEPIAVILMKGLHTLARTDDPDSVISLMDLRDSGKSILLGEADNNWQGQRYVQCQNSVTEFFTPLFGEDFNAPLDIPKQGFFSWDRTAKGWIFQPRSVNEAPEERMKRYIERQSRPATQNARSTRLTGIV